MQRKILLISLAVLVLGSSLLISVIAQAPVPHGKKGVGLVTNDCAVAEALRASWFYNWWWNPTQCQNVTPYLMIWDDQTQPENWRYLTDGAAVFLYNEPDLCPTQACMTAEEQAVHMHDFVEVQLPNKPLIAPAPAGDITNVVTVYDAYLNLYGSAPDWRGLALHCHGQSALECINKTQNFIDQATTWGLTEVWVTEWSICNLSEAETYRQWLEANPFVAGYAWFSDIQSYSANNCDTRLWVDGQLTIYGQWYQSGPVGLPIGAPTDWNEWTLTPTPVVTPISVQFTPWPKATSSYLSPRQLSYTIKLPLLWH